MKLLLTSLVRYANGDQREGFFEDNILDGQVIFTRSDGTTIIEKWIKGEKISDNLEDESDEDDEEDEDEDIDNSSEISQVENNSISISEQIRGGSSRGNVWKSSDESLKPVDKHSNLVSMIRSRARSFLFKIYSGVN